jgi:hypothetical protein
MPTVREAAAAVSEESRDRDAVHGRNTGAARRPVHKLCPMCTIMKAAKHCPQPKELRAQSSDDSFSPWRSGPVSPLLQARQKKTASRVAAEATGDTWLAPLAGAEGGPWERSLAWTGWGRTALLRRES